MKQVRDYSPARKALEINLDNSFYGTFAEIGAGQEVARHFFQAGRASNTVAKSISAYDMTFSDEIYGKSERYVSEPRLMKMLDHEYSLIQERLRQQRGDHTCFFAFADTVATASQEDGPVKSHGWLGIRFQTKPNGPSNDVIMHVKLWDRFRLQQQEALGILGVNFISMALHPPQRAEERISQLIESLNTKRVEVNMIRFSGPDLQHLDNRLLSLELVKQHLTEAVLFSPSGEVLHAGDAFFRRPLLIQRGTFRPVTNSNIEILSKAEAQFKEHHMLKDLGPGHDPKVLFEITMNSLSSAGGGAGDTTQVDAEDFLHRVDTLGILGFEVLISNFRLFYQMKSYLRQATSEPLGILVGASLLPKMFDETFYKPLPGGILEGMSRLFDDKTRIFVVPDKSAQICTTAGLYRPPEQLEFLYQHLISNQLITDVLRCEDIDTSTHSSLVRSMLERGDGGWKKLVPEKVRELIEARQLFGYRPK